MTPSYTVWFPGQELAQRTPIPQLFYISLPLPWIPLADSLAIPFSKKIMETLFIPHSGYTCALSYEPVYLSMRNCALGYNGEDLNEAALFLT